MDPSKLKILTISGGDKDIIIKSLGYRVVDGYLKEEDGSPVTCPFTKEQLCIENTAIVPGSTLVISTKSSAISRYISYLERGPR